MVGGSLESPSSSTVGIQMTLRYLSGTIETLNYTCSWRLILSRGVGNSDSREQRDVL